MQLEFKEIVLDKLKKFDRFQNKHEGFLFNEFLIATENYDDARVKGEVVCMGTKTPEHPFIINEANSKELLQIVE